MPSSETFHWEVHDLINQFEDFLNEVVIRRYDNDKEIKDRIKVNLLWGHKQRVLHDIVNKQQHIVLPVIAVTMGGLTRDEKRVFNKIDGSYIDTLTDKYRHLNQPVPVDLKLNVSIMTRYQIDMDQILTNFIPYCDPYVVVSWKWPDETTGKIVEIRSTVMWDGQANTAYPMDRDGGLQKTEPIRYIVDTTFTLKGWLFKNSPNFVKKIYVIENTFTSLSAINYNYQLTTSQMYQGNTDTLYVSAKPFIYKASPYCTVLNVPTETVVKGNMMDYVSGVFVSGSPGVFPSETYQNPLAWNPAVSANYPGFTGILIPRNNWTFVDRNTITLTIPSAANPGYIDIIAVNEAGYGTLITDSATVNPSATYRFPYENGIEVANIAGI